MITKQRKNAAGFTLVEMMMALIVASIVLAAVATLAQATTAADDATKEMGRQQVQLQQMTARLTDLIRRANEVVSSSDGEFLLWHDADNDGSATFDELTRIRTAVDDTGIEIVDWGTYQDCTNVEFKYKSGDTQVMILFNLEENGIVVPYSISATLRASKR